MAKLSISLKRTFGEEGVWSNGKGKNANDRGGRTYKGIAETANPKWAGWAIIDKHINDKNFPKCLEQNNELQALVLELYTKKYWNLMWGDKINNQLIADDIFDTSVNVGVGTAIKLRQRSHKLKETSVMNDETLNFLNSIV